MGFPNNTGAIGHDDTIVRPVLPMSNNANKLIKTDAAGFLSSVFLSTPAGAEMVYYISTLGNDSYTGSYSQPLASIQQAITNAVATAQTNVVIYLFPGTYSDIYTVTGIASLTIEGMGSARDSVIISGVSTVSGGTSITFRNLQFTDNVIIDDVPLTILDKCVLPLSAAGKMISLDSSSDITVRLVAVNYTQLLNVVLAHTGGAVNTSSFYASDIILFNLTLGDKTIANIWNSAIGDGSTVGAITPGGTSSIYYANTQQLAAITFVLLVGTTVNAVSSRIHTINSTIGTLNLSTFSYVEALTGTITSINDQPASQVYYDNTSTPLIDADDVQEAIEDIYTRLINQLDWQEAVISFIDMNVGGPGGPAAVTGNRYIDNAGGGVYTTDYIYEYDGAMWVEIIPNEGFSLCDKLTNQMYVYTGAAWALFGTYITIAASSVTTTGFTNRLLGITDAQAALDIVDLNTYNVTIPIAATHVLNITADYCLLVDGNVTSAITLPASGAGIAIGQKFIIKDSAGTSNVNNITINRQGADVIDGAVSFVINTIYDSITIIYGEATKYYII